MAVKLTGPERRFLVAVFGDIPMRRREALFQGSQCPAQCGPAVIQAGYELKAFFRDHPTAEPVPPGRRVLHPALV